MTNAFYHFLFCLDMPCGFSVVLWRQGGYVDVPWQIVSRAGSLRSAAPSSCFTGGEPEAWHDTAPPVTDTVRAGLLGPNQMSTALLYTACTPLTP